MGHKKLVGEEARARDERRAAYKLEWQRRKFGYSPQVYGCHCEHGTLGRYHHGGCRCEACRAANTLRMREWKAQRRGTEPPSHGASGYTNYGCRCEVCYEAHSEKMREYWLTREARS